MKVTAAASTKFLEMLEDPDIQITMTPSGTTIFSEFMFKVGLIDNRPEFVEGPVLF